MMVNLTPLEKREAGSRSYQKQQSASTNTCPDHSSPLECSPHCLMARRPVLALVASGPSSLVSSGPANRTQLQQAFYEHYIPPGYRDSGPVNPLQWIVQTAQAGTSPALSSAVNAVSALVLNRATLDPRFLHAAVSSYATAVSQARAEMATTSERSVLIATAHTLTLCELFYRVSLDETQARPHSRLILQLTQSEAIRAGADDPAMSIMMRYGVRLLATWETLVSRKSPFAVSDLAAEFHAHAAGSPDDLMNLGIYTASLIEEGDVLLERSIPSALETLKYLDAVVRLKGMLHEWMTSRNSQSSRPLYWLVAVERHRFPTVRGTSTVFPFLYEFPDLFVGNLHATYWMCLLELTHMHIQIINAVQQDLEFGTPEYLSLRRAMNEYANNICMSILFIAKAEHAWCGRMSATRPLHLLCQHFVRTADWRKLAWCVHCAEDLGCIRVEGCKASRISIGGIDLNR